MKSKWMARSALLALTAAVLVAVGWAADLSEGKQPATPKPATPLVPKPPQAQGEPHIGYVYPAGGQAGTTVTVIVGGQNLATATNAYISGYGVEAVVAEHEPVIGGKVASELRDRLKELRNKDRSPEVVKETMDIRHKLVAFEKQRIAPAIGETIPVRVSIAADAAPGNHELRLGALNGLSNPLVFQVGQLPELQKPEPPPNDNWAQIRELKKQPSARLKSGADNAPPLAVTLPVTINGQILPGGVDRFRFHALPGQHVVVAASARELVPYLADAVPGWFQAAVTLYDAKGSELAYNDHYLFHPDPVLLYTIPAAGEYVLEIHDALYRGREDFVYRVAIGQLPFLASIFPLGGRAGTRCPVELLGWNLPVSKLTLNLKDDMPGIQPVWARYNGLTSSMPFAVDSLPECLAREPDASPANAQPVALPVIINGHISKKGDWNVFRFKGRKDDKIVAEVMARRLGSPLDSLLILTDAQGKQLALNDDHEDKSVGLETHHADSYLAATLPAAGNYFLHIGDAQQNGGWAYGYRLRISPPQPDFVLRAVPSSVNVRAGTNVPLTVYAVRRDGFTGEISMALKDAPQGFKLTGGKIPAGEDKGQFTLAAPPREMPGPVELHLEGRATIEGREVVHPAVPADDMMQAFANHHLVPAQQMLVDVTRRPPPRPPVRIVSALPVKIPAGGTATLRVSGQVPPGVGMVQFELHQPPDGIIIQGATPAGGDMEVVLHADPAKVHAGLTGNLIINAFGMRTLPAANGRPAQRRVPLGALPAVAFEIVAQ